MYDNRSILAPFYGQLIVLISHTANWSVAGRSGLGVDYDLVGP